MKSAPPVNRSADFARIASAEQKPVSGLDLNFCRLLWVDHGASRRGAGCKAALLSPEYLLAIPFVNSERDLVVSSPAFHTADGTWCVNSEYCE
jgi:hypothetical protein